MAEHAKGFGEAEQDYWTPPMTASAPVPIEEAAGRLTLDEATDALSRHLVFLASRPDHLLSPVEHLRMRALNVVLSTLATQSVLLREAAAVLTVMDAVVVPRFEAVEPLLARINALHPEKETRGS